MLTVSLEENDDGVLGRQANSLIPSMFFSSSRSSRKATSLYAETARCAF
jgi:hypothetical protein